MSQSSSRTGRAPSAGFTLLELMIALAIVGILLTVAAPSFRNALLNVRISAQTNDLMADLALARSEAVKRNQTVMLCTSANQTTCEGAAWSDGWLVFVDADNDGVWDAGEPVIKARPAAEGNNTIASVGHKGAGVLYMPYKPSGITGQNAGIAFAICDSRTTLNTGRHIKISVTGRPLVERVTCPFTPTP